MHYITVIEDIYIVLKTEEYKTIEIISHVAKTVVIRQSEQIIYQFIFK